MELQEAYNLKGWADEEVAKREVLQKYSALQQALQQNAQRAQNQPAIPFNDQKKALLDTLNAVNIFGLSNPQLMVLEKLNILQHIGSVQRWSRPDLLPFRCAPAEATEHPEPWRLSKR